MVSLAESSILLTGAGGFLGGAILAFLRAAGARVIGTARHPATPADPPLLAIDLADPASLARLDAVGHVDAIVHCAAVLPGKASDMELLLANQQMTWHLAGWAAHRNVPHFLLASGCNVYGAADRPATEEAPPHPRDAYAVSKLACEHLARAAAAGSGMRVCALRISAPYGPRLRAETVVKRFLTQAAAGKSLTLLGTGARSQDFVFEADVARAFAMAIQHEADGVFNISGQRSITMLELAETALRIIGRPVEGSIVFAGPDPQEGYRGRFPTDAATRAFGWRPEVDLEDGLRLTASAWGLL